MSEIVLCVLYSYFCEAFEWTGASCIASKLAVPKVQCGHVSVLGCNTRCVLVPSVETEEVFSLSLP